MFFFGPKNPVFGPKLIFFVWDRVFWQSGARNPRRWFRFGTFGSILRFFVSELRPFSRGEPGRRAQKSYPTPLWGHRLPVTALALSARGLDKRYFTTVQYNITMMMLLLKVVSSTQGILHNHLIIMLMSLWKQLIASERYSTTVLSARRCHRLWLTAKTVDK